MLITVTINNITYQVPKNISILSACKFIGLNIPRFCYHELLSISGNCRMCLVEIVGLEKPVASCVSEVEEGMSICLDTPFVKKARANVVESILLNHPLDCPICDQAGECDLQDQARLFGNYSSRLFLKKNTVEDKNCGPLIKMVMTRCITCTRCVRYATEVAEVESLATLNRGVNTEIGLYVENIFQSEIAGNVIDLCPVGALTSKDYAFKKRPWELRVTESIDTTDSLNSNVYIDSGNNSIWRILPKINESINDSLISDKARFSFDGLFYNRLKSIYQFVKTDKLKNYGYKAPNSSVSNFSYQLLTGNKKVNFIIDEKLDLVNAVFLKKLFNKYPNRLRCFTLNKTNPRGNFYFPRNQHLAQRINTLDDLIFFVGANLKVESAILNTKIRFKHKNNPNTSQNIRVFGVFFNDNQNVDFVNLNILKIFDIISNKHFLFSRELNNTKNPFFIFGESFLNRLNSLESFLNHLYIQLPHVCAINLHTTVNSEALNYLNLLSKPLRKHKYTDIAINLDDSIQSRRALNLFNINSLTKETKNTPEYYNRRNTFYTYNKRHAVWFNTHGSYLSSQFKMIVPWCTSFESEFLFMNIEGRPQKSAKILSTGYSYSLSKIFKIKFPSIVNHYTNFITEITSANEKYENIPYSSFLFNVAIQYLFRNSSSSVINVSTYPLKQPIKNFYMTDTLTRHSKNMVECAAVLQKNSNNFYT